MLPANYTGPYSEESIQAVKDAMDVLDVIQDYIPDLKREGANWVASSPLGLDKTPSFKINPEKNFFKDFSQGHGGDAIKFLMVYQNMTYRQAIEYLAKKYGVELKAAKPIHPRPEVIDKRREELLHINEWAAQKYHELLLAEGEGSEGLDHLLLRGVTPAQIEEFRLGYAPNRYDTLFKLSRKVLKYPYATLEDASVLKRNTKGDNFYDFFRHRIMFPITEQDGKVIAFSGRTLFNSTQVPKDKMPPKYLNSHENYIFKKGATFFGLYQALDHIRKFNQVYLVEGPMDVLAFNRAGLKNVVCLNGTALNESAVKTLARYTRNFIIALDGDAPGQKAISMHLPLLLKYSTTEKGSVKILSFPSKQDPEEFLNTNGPEVFINHCQNNQQGFIESLIENQWKSEQDAVKRSKVIKTLITTISYIEDKILYNVYLTKLSEMTGVSHEDIVSEAEAVAQERTRKNQDYLEKIIKVESRTRVDVIRTAIKILLKYGNVKTTDQGTIAENMIVHLMQSQFKPVAEMDKMFFNTVYTTIKKINKFSVEAILKESPSLVDLVRELDNEKFLVSELMYNERNRGPLYAFLYKYLPELLPHIKATTQDPLVKGKVEYAIKSFENKPAVTPP